MSVQSDPLLREQPRTEAKPLFWTRKRIAATAFFVLVIAGFMYAAAKASPSSSSSSTGGVNVECPHSPAWMHATCGMTFQVSDFMCKDVKEEVERRIQGKDGWTDPKSHPGKYLLLDSQPGRTLAQRTTGDGSNYVDKFLFTYTDVEGEGCLVTGCSAAQSASYYDYSTNYCNMHNLLCGKAEGCKVSRHDIRPPKESFHECLFHDVTMCTR
jgi:hypothetical protein